MRSCCKPAAVAILDGFPLSDRRTSNMLFPDFLAPVRPCSARQKEEKARPRCDVCLMILQLFLISPNCFCMEKCLSSYQDSYGQTQRRALGTTKAERSPSLFGRKDASDQVLFSCCCFKAVSEGWRDIDQSLTGTSLSDGNLRPPKLVDNFDELLRKTLPSSRNMQPEPLFRQ